VRFQSLALVSALALTAAACSENVEPLGPLDGGAPALDRRAEGEGGPIRLFQVTIENLTSGQPLSPGVVVVHRPTASLFAAGTYASAGIQAIAEDGNPAPAAGALPGVPGVFDVVATSAPVFQVGGPGPNTLTLTINAEPNGNVLSLALMLICSNDGFAGLNAVKLPANRTPRVYYAYAYDAGTEENDEASTSIVDPCFAIGPVAGAADGNARTASNGRIRHHRGIRGVGDLTRAHSWDGAIARVTIERIG
jgi:hypothetical protein